MRKLAIVLLLTLLFISQFNTIIDIDLWWNLKAGEYILENLRVPRYDIFSYTLYDKPWIDHEWLSQIIFYFVFSVSGWPGLNILKAVVISLSFLIVFLLAVSKNKRTIYPLFLTMAAVLAFGYRSVLRPEIFSYLLFCAFLYMLEKRKNLYILPFLQILWVNMHGYFIMGPALVLLYSIGEFFSRDKDEARKLVFIFSLCAAACFINPYFHRGAFYPVRMILDVFTEQRLFVGNVHELMMPIKANFRRFIFFWVFAIMTSITFIINLKKVKIRHAIIFALSFAVSYIAVRNMPIFIFTALPLAAINLNEAALTKDISGKRYYSIAIIILIGFIYFFLSNSYYIFTNQYGLRRTAARFSPLFMPSGACDFLERNDIKGTIFNTLDFGPYIGYRFYPERRIFIDTRTDLYKDEFYALYRKAQNYPEYWNAIQKEYGFKIVLLRHLFGGTERIIRYLYRDGEWKLVYYDKNSCIFLSDIPENSGIISRFEIDFKNKKVDQADLDINVAGFFEKIGEYGPAEEIYVKLLEKDPKLLRAGNNLAAIYIHAGRYNEAVKLLESFLEHYPRSAELYANMGAAYMRMGMFAEAISMLEESQKLDPYLRKVSYMLGSVYLKRGELDRALRQFEKYSKLDPYNPDAHRFLGDIYAQKGLLKEAQREYNEADALEGVGW